MAPMARVAHSVFFDFKVVSNEKLVQRDRYYEGKMNKPFVNEERTEELKRRINSVWSVCATNTKEIIKSMKQFFLGCVPLSIKMMFGLWNV